MPGRSRAQARDSFLAPLKRSLSCVTNSQLYVPETTSASGDVLGALTLSEEPLVLRSDRLGGNILLELRHQFRYVKEREHRWHVSTVGYLYQLYDEAGQELVSWHWHPESNAYPHLHAASGVLDKRIHLPTGRMSIESLLRMLLTDFAVHPRRDDFMEVLAKAEEPFIEHRRWHA